MPTINEWKELENTNNCTWEWIALGGVNGYKVTSKITGYEDKWIFLPAAGLQMGYSVESVGYNGSYLSSSLYSSRPECLYGVGFSSNNVSYGSGDRCYGQSVRPVSQ